MHRLIISCPFGNYVRLPGVTSTLGTYTLHRRAGFWKRLWRVLSTVRYDPVNRSWVNRLGLPNPGIEALKDASECILSVHGFCREEWVQLVRRAEELGALAVELNLSCPNVERRGQMIEEVALALKGVRIPCIAKLPPQDSLNLGKPLFDLGVRMFHLSNTIPTPRGGMSGKPLLPLSLEAVRQFRNHFGDRVRLIGGGGVTCLEDVKAYLDAGADHVAVASMLLNPLNWRKVIRFRDFLGEHK